MSPCLEVHASDTDCFVCVTKDWKGDMIYRWLWGQQENTNHLVHTLSKSIVTSVGASNYQGRRFETVHALGVCRPWRRGEYRKQEKEGNMGLWGPGLGEIFECIDKGVSTLQRWLPEGLRMPHPSSRRSHEWQIRVSYDLRTRRTETECGALVGRKEEQSKSVV